MEVYPSTGRVIHLLTRPELKIRAELMGFGTTASNDSVLSRCDLPCREYCDVCIVREDAFSKRISNFLSRASNTHLPYTTHTLPSQRSLTHKSVDVLLSTQMRGKVGIWKSSVVLPAAILTRLCLAASKVPDHSRQSRGSGARVIFPEESYWPDTSLSEMRCR